MVALRVEGRGETGMHNASLSAGVGLKQRFGINARRELQCRYNSPGNPCGNRARARTTPSAASGPYLTHVRLPQMVAGGMPSTASPLGAPVRSTSASHRSTSSGTPATATRSRRPTRGGGGRRHERNRRWSRRGTLRGGWWRRWLAHRLSRRATRYPVRGSHFGGPPPC